MTINITPLERAVARLEEGLARHRAEPADSQLRDGLIQRFEFTYDLSHKMLRRALEAAAAAPAEIDRMSFPTLIRTGYEQGLLERGWPEWEAYRKMRNITSHTYDEAQANAVVAMIPEFLEVAQNLVGRLSDGGVR
ncbi:HI0074 family nucleotidyltransferase substrate-binding subunit [Pelagerythrobacter sp.]|uniref:HI0074 family nucleotidyltransferase substrate-binding subunit n=1 Tax=Pelagerythrobacter sp. TaxID=2800702 RepID=UPI0035B145B8